MSSGGSVLVSPDTSHHSALSVVWRGKDTRPAGRGQPVTECRIPVPQTDTVSIRAPLCDGTSRKGAISKKQHTLLDFNDGGQVDYSKLRLAGICIWKGSGKTKSSVHRSQFRVGEVHDSSVKRSLRMTKYEVCLEISGPTAMWTRPDSGDSPTSYPVPTRCAVKGIFESVLWLRSAQVAPSRVEICAPLHFHTYTTNYGGPLRKSGTANYQLIATVLIDVCYRLYANIRAYNNPGGPVTEAAKSWAHTNGAHAYQAILERRLARGQFFRTPCLGWQEFVPDYLGPFRAPTLVQKDLTFVIPSLLESVFPQQGIPNRNPQFVQNVRIEKGTLVYAARAL